jgi:hypothetical protein
MVTKNLHLPAGTLCKAKFPALLVLVEMPVLFIKATAEVNGFLSVVFITLPVIVYWALLLKATNIKKIVRYLSIGKWSFIAIDNVGFSNIKLRNIVKLF